MVLNHVMVRIAAHRLQALALVLAAALALVGQAFASAAMTMQSATAAMAGMAPSGSAMCPACKGMDASRAALSDCSTGACFGGVAVLPAVAAFDAAMPTTFVTIAESDGRGIIVPPDPGPPRLLPLT